MNIVITGGSKGLGKAIATAFAADKQVHHFFLCARTKDEQEKTGKALKASIPAITVHTKTCNVADKKELSEFAGWIFSFTDRIDILVNNAGIQFVSPVEDFPDDKWEAILAINLSAPT